MTHFLHIDRFDHIHRTGTKQTENSSPKDSVPPPLPPDAHKENEPKEPVLSGTPDSDVPLGRILVFDSGAKADLVVEIAVLLIGFVLIAGCPFMIRGLFLPSEYARFDPHITLNNVSREAEKIKRENTFRKLNMMIGAAEFFLISGLVYYGILIILVRKTEITVGENGIAGRGVGKAFIRDFTLRPFHLSYDKITGVDTTRNEVAVNISGMKYRCAAANPVVIQEMILKQMIVCRLNAE